MCEELLESGEWVSVGECECVTQSWFLLLDPVCEQDRAPTFSTVGLASKYYWNYSEKSSVLNGDCARLVHRFGAPNYLVFSQSSAMECVVSGVASSHTNLGLVHCVVQQVLRVYI